MPRSWDRQFQMPAWKPRSLRRRRRQSIGFSRQSISAQAANVKGWAIFGSYPNTHARSASACSRRSSTGSKKEYTFHIDLGIEFLFHSDGAKATARQVAASE